MRIQFASDLHLELRPKMTFREIIEPTVAPVLALLGDIAPLEHVGTLARELDRMHGTSGFGDCKSMGELTAMHISMMLDIKPSSTTWMTQA